MSIAKTLSTAVAVGNGVLDNISDSNHALVTHAAVPAWSGDGIADDAVPFAGLLIGNKRSSNEWQFELRVDADNFLAFRYDSGSGATVFFDVADVRRTLSLGSGLGPGGHQAYWIGTDTSAVPSGGSAVLWFHRLADDWTLESQSIELPAGHNWSALASQAGATFTLGGRGDGQRGDGIIGTMLWAANPAAAQAVPSDSDIIRCLARPNMLGELGEYTDYFAAMGDVVDPSNDLVDLLTYATASAANHRVRCPHTGSVATLSVTGSPEFRTSHMVPTRSGSTVTRVTYKPGHAADPNDPDLVWLSGVSRDQVPGGREYMQPLRFSTGRVAGPAMTLQGYRQSDAGAVVRGVANPTTDTHDAEILFIVQDAIVAQRKKHHSGDSSGREVLESLVIDDDATEGALQQPTLGGLDEIDRTAAYLAAADVGTKIVCVTRLRPQASGRILVYTIDKATKTIDAFQLITGAAAGGDSLLAGRDFSLVARGDDDGFAVIWNLATTDSRTVGPCAVLGSVSGFADANQWFDSTGTSLGASLGVVKANDPRFALIGDNISAGSYISYADMHETFLGNAVSRDGYVAGLLRRFDGGADSPLDGINLSSVRFLSWRFDGDGLTTAADEDISGAFQTAGGGPMDPIAFSTFNAAGSAVLLLGPSGRGAAIVFADRGASSMSTATNSVYFDFEFGREVHTLEVPDIATGAGITYGEKLWDVSTNGGLGARPRAPGIDNALISGRYVLLDILADKAGGTSNEGAVTHAAADAQVTANQISGRKRPVRTVRGRGPGARTIR